MDSVTRATVRAGRGIVGNADTGGRRQVTIIAQRAWESAVTDLGVKVEPVARRANLLLSGISLEQTRGQTLLIGGCRLLIRGETRPCERMDEAQAGLRTALRPGWRGGVFAEVLDDGEIEVGAPVEWAPESTS
ncbi:MAG: MOSC domain-containing protein [Gemmatimonadales bacterium]